MRHCPFLLLAFAASLPCQERAGLAADLQRLIAYTPRTVAPTEPEVLAAERALAQAMPRLVRQGGDLVRELERLLGERGGVSVPTKAAPIRDADPLLRTLVRFDTERTLTAAPAETRAHASAGGFPGDVAADAATVANTLAVDLAVPGRHSTGLYARPGTVVRCTFAGERPQGLRVRIGAHSDNIERRGKWPRMPRISRTFDVQGARLDVANAFGGLVYVEVPKDAAGTLRATIAGAVEAPWFELGVTDPAVWRERMRLRPGPWAELGTRKVVLTVPSAAIRALDDPTALLQFWDLVLDGAADLAARPRARERAERYVADLEISAGAMHSGYPIMTHLDAVADMVSLERMRRGPWGLFHELGHNHQNGDWTFAGTGEVTVNLFSLYLCETMCGKPWHAAWGGNVGRAKQRLPKVLAAGELPWGGDGDGKADLSLRLLMYSQLQQQFGWGAFSRCFAGYHELAADARPRSEEQKRDQWLVRFSRTVGRDLGGFFVAWGVPTSAEARASLADLPAWLPDDWPAGK